MIHKSVYPHSGLHRIVFYLWQIKNMAIERSRVPGGEPVLRADIGENSVMSVMAIDFNAEIEADSTTAD